MSDASRLTGLSRTGPSYPPDKDEPDGVDAGGASASQQTASPQLQGLSHPPARRSIDQSGSSAVDARFRPSGATASVDRSTAHELLALKARYPDAPAASLRGLAAEGFSFEDIGRIAGSEGGAAALAELHEHKYLGALRGVGFSDAQVVDIAASGNGAQTIHHALQVYAALTSAHERYNGMSKVKIGHETTINAICGSVGTRAMDMMLESAERGETAQLLVRGLFFSHFQAFKDKQGKDVDDVIRHAEIFYGRSDDVYQAWGEVMQLRESYLSSGLINFTHLP